MLKSQTQIPEISDARTFHELNADLTKLQDDIRAKLIDGDFDELAGMIDIKGNWERKLAKEYDLLSPEVAFEQREIIDRYIAADIEIVALLKDKMKLTETNIQKAAIARRIISNFGISEGETRKEKSRVEPGSFFDTSG